jgi:hypothetical protein
MTYDPTIPKATLSPSNSATSTQTNFSTYQTAFTANHVAINDSNQGKHAGVVLKTQSSDPDILNNYDALYCKNSISQTGTQPQLFSRIPKFLPNELTNSPIQLTYNQVVKSGVTTPSNSSMYQSFMFGGYVIFMNQTTVTFSSGTTITLTPTPTKILNVIAQPLVDPVANGTFAYSVNITTTSTFKISVKKISTALTSATFSWIAICTV